MQPEEEEEDNTPGWFEQSDHLILIWAPKSHSQWAKEPGHLFLGRLWIQWNLRPRNLRGTPTSI